MKTRIYNVKYAVFEPQTELKTGEVRIEDDRITYAGPAREDGEPFDRVIDGRGGLLLPGFKNAHTHSSMTMLRSRADDMPLQPWLFDQVFPFEGRLTDEDAYTLSKLAYMEYVSGGITCGFDMYIHLDAAAQAAVDTGFRMLFFNGINDFGGDAELAAYEFNKFNSLHPLIGGRVGIHGEYTTSEPLMRSIAEVAQSLKTPFYAHIAETKSETAGCYERYGVGPVEKLASLGAFRYGGAGFHMVHLSERERQIAGEYGVGAITCPGSNAKLASGIAPICAFLKEGIKVGIGTDGAGSNNCLDFFREMFLVTALQKLQQEDASACDALEVLKMACVNGAELMALPDCNGIAPGKQADLTLLDLSHPNMQPENNILKNVVYSGSKQNVRLTMVAGRILYEEGRFPTVEDPEKIYRDSTAIIRRLEREVG